MLRVQEKHHEYLLFAPAECKAQVVAHRPRDESASREEISSLSARRASSWPPGAARACAPHTGVFREVRGAASRQPADRAERRQLACEVDRALSLDAGTKQIASSSASASEAAPSASSRREDAPAEASRYRHGIRLKSSFRCF